MPAGALLAERLQRGVTPVGLEPASTTSATSVKSTIRFSVVPPMSEEATVLQGGCCFAVGNACTPLDGKQFH